MRKPIKSEIGVLVPPPNIIKPTPAWRRCLVSCYTLRLGTSATSQLFLGQHRNSKLHPDKYKPLKAPTFVHNTQEAKLKAFFKAGAASLFDNWMKYFNILTKKLLARQLTSPERGKKSMTTAEESIK